MPLAAGSTLGPYEVIALLGAGGMGEVYRARDPRLGREVALKVFSDNVASSPDRLSRFEREAKTVAGLNHPNIVTLHSIEQADGVRFLTMELIEGKSLDRAIVSGGLPIPRVIELGIALADALAAAHERGVVHRDLKPANVMLTKHGRVKVLDFGLAKLLQEDSVSGSQEMTSAPTAVESPAAPLTSAGTVMGTVPYMSPEQANGDVLDARTDLFSLGVLLYEMVTGERPFRGRTSAETISSILRDPPKPVNETRQDAPRHLERILDHCLQKDRESRFQTAKDVRNELQALRREMESGESARSSARSAVQPSSRPAARGGRGKGLWIGVAAVPVVVVAALVAVVVFRGRGVPAPHSAGEAASPDSKTIAVLPFVNMSSDKEQEYFSDGISEELLNLLARIPELKVTARTSSFSFKGKEVEVPEVARLLHVANVLEGSVRKSGDQVRITAQLVHAADGFQFWSATYDRKLDDVFKVQDEIAGEVVRKLKVTLLGAAPMVRQTDPKAYTLWLQAQQLSRQMSPEAITESDTLLRQVLEIDPRYAPAWIGLADNFSFKGNLALLPSSEAFARAREATEKALAIDPNFAPAHANLGSIAILTNDFVGAAKHLERALALDPNDPGVLYVASMLLSNVGRLSEALVVDEALVRRDPVNVGTLAGLGSDQLMAGQFDAAIETFRSVLNLSPDYGGAHLNFGTAMLFKGDARAALTEIEQEKLEALRLTGLTLAYHGLGRKTESDAALAALIKKFETEASYNIASAYAYRGENDKAFEWLDKAIQYQDSGLSLVVQDILFDNIHSDPRWVLFLRKIGRAPEQLAKIQFEVALPKDF